MTQNSIEFAYYLIIQLSRWAVNDSWIMFAVSAAITIICSYRAIRRLSIENAPLIYFLFLLVILPFTMNAVRQGIAMSIVFYALNYIAQGNFKKYALIVFVASLFHASALLMLPVYLVRHITQKKHHDARLTLCLSLIIALTIGVILPLIIKSGASIPILGHYMTYEGQLLGVGLTTILFKLILIVPLILFYTWMSIKNKDTKLLAMLFLLEVAVLGLGSVSGVFARISYYFSLAGLVYIALVPSIFTSPSAKRSVKFSVILYGLAFFIVTYYVVGYDRIFPYNWLLSGVIL